MIRIKKEKLIQFLILGGFKPDNAIYSIHVNDLDDYFKSAFKSIFESLLNEGEKSLGDIYYDIISFEIYDEAFWIYFSCLDIMIKGIGGAYKDEYFEWSSILKANIDYYFRNNRLDFILDGI